MINETHTQKEDPNIIDAELIYICRHCHKQKLIVNNKTKIYKFKLKIEASSV